MEIDVLTLFPKMFDGPLTESMMGRAQTMEHLSTRVHDIRQWAVDKHGTVDHTPYGGGGGMVLMAQPLADGIRSVQSGHGRGRVIYLSADGSPLSQSTANRLSLAPHLILLCGHYRGIDERIREKYVDEEVSIGDYVVTGGELPALVLIDSVVRLIPGVLGDFQSASDDSFQNDLLDCPWYAKPQQFEGTDVPTELLSGDHAAIEQWRQEAARSRTEQRRPDLLLRQQKQTLGGSPATTENDS
jgi:tRNA (guanine37-N1)-methyltransferase